MRFSQAKFSNPATGIQHEGQADADDLAQDAQPRILSLSSGRETLQASGVASEPTVPILQQELSAESCSAPAWQNAFLMGPNVRFTRTREVDITGRRAPEETLPIAQPPARAQPVAQIAEPVGAELRILMTPSRADQVAGIHAAPLEDMTLPVTKHEPSELPKSELAVSDPLEPVVITTALPKAPDATREVSPSLSDVMGPIAAPAGESRFANLSDFAFWDAMPFDGEFLFKVKPRQTSHTPIPEIEVEAESIVAKYRIVECRRTSQIAGEQQAVEDLPVTGTLAPVEDVRAAAPVVDVAGATEREVAAEPEVCGPQAFSPAAFLGESEIGAESYSDSDRDHAPIPSDATASSTVEPIANTELAIDPVAAITRSQNNEPLSTFTPRRPAALTPIEWRPIGRDDEYELPPRDLLQEPVARSGVIMTQETLEQNAGLLESILEDFGVKGEIIHVRPGPVVTLYEFEPAPGVKSSRVINLADDIARSMSALSARVAVVPGRNVIGIELPNAIRETVYFREMIESADFERSGYKLALGIGKTIGGEPVIAELAKMPHLLVAGTTGSGKSVAINTMILSLLYRMTPEQCRLIMVDPKMLELSIYDGIPHLLTPVVTDPKKAVMALKWAVREMEDRYRKMSRLGVRNIDGYNSRVAVARGKGETIHVMVQTGFDKSTGAPIEESQEMDLTPMPYIVVIVDEMADLMMVAGKEIEGAIQRLAQMARAAGIHLIMATQRPSVDVITGTIKANFPTRISFQVTSKIDSRTILGEPGAEQLLGQGDMLHMAGGGRISRVHGPFVSDEEVEKVVAHLKMQGRPEYLDTVTADEEEEVAEEDTAVFDKGAIASEDGDDLYEQAIKVILRDKKCSTSYIQRRLGIGYNRAASLVERMEKDGLVGPANHVGKREIISGNRSGVGLAVGEDYN